MPIEYRQGDLIEAFKAGDVHVIAHQANCFNTMASGVAKAIREAFPEAYEADCATVKGDHGKLGGLTSCINNYGLIFNLYGQYNYGRQVGVVYTRIEALESALISMKLVLQSIEYSGKIGLPKLGCGLGGEKWEDVSAIIERVFDEHTVIVYSL